MNLKTATTFLMALVGSASAFGIGKHHSFGKISSLVMNKDQVHLPRANQHKLHVTTTPIEDQTFIDEENPYVTYSLEEVLMIASAGFHNVIKNGYSGTIDGKEINIATMDPLNLSTLSREIKNEHADVKFTLNDPVLTGLDTIKFDSVSEIDYKNNMQFSIALDVSELVLSCDDYDREGTFKLIFKERDITKLDRSLKFTLSDVNLNFAFKLLVTEDGAEVKVVESDFGDHVEIGKMESNIEDSFIFNTIAPIAKDHLASAVSKSIGSALGNFLTAKLQAVGQSQQGIADMLNRIYKTKQKQGLLVDSEGNELKPRFLEGLEGVGQLPIPMFWEITSVPIDKLDHTTISEVAKTCKTGDVMMFQTIARGSKIIRRFTQSPFSHALMIVKEEEFNEGKPVVIQATSGSHFDLIQQKHIKGIQINDLEYVLDEYHKNWGLGSEYKDDPGRVVFRSLNMEDRGEDEKQFLEALFTFIRETNGIAYAENSSMYELYVSGLVEIDLEEQDDRTFYCASYVAEALMKYGIITDEFESHQYGPRDFSMKYDTLPFVEDTTSYGNEVVVDLMRP